MANTATTSGNREDKTNILALLAPQETPFFSLIAKETPATAMLTDWQNDDLPNPTFGGQEEGKDFSQFDDKSKERETLENRQERFVQTYKVSKEQQAVSTAGVPSEIANSQAKCDTVLKNSIEAALCSDQVRQKGSGAQKSRLEGMGKLSDPNNANIPAAYRTPAASIVQTSSLTEDTYRAGLQSRFEVAGKRGNLMQINGTVVQNKVTDFTRTEGTTTAKPFTVNVDMAQKSLTLSVMHYNSDYGVIDHVVSLFNGRVSGQPFDDQAKERAYCFSPEMYEVRYLVRPGTEELEDGGGGARGFTDAILTLIAENMRDIVKFQN